MTFAKLNKSSDFLPLLHRIFRIRLEGADPIDLELVRVTELGELTDTAHRQPFSLLFLGPLSNQYLLQHTYRLEHNQMDTLELFIVPLAPDKGRMQYEAIFN